MGRARSLVVSSAACVVAVTAAGCTRCEAPLELASEPVTDAMMALPVAGVLEDREPPRRERNGCEYGDEEHWATLGPLRARYTAWDYKGQTVTTGVAVYLASASCARVEIPFTMETRSSVRLRHDTERDLFVVSNGDEKRGAIVLRRKAGR